MRNWAKTVSILEQGCNHKTPSSQLHFQPAWRQLRRAAAAPWPPPGPQQVSEGLVRKPLPREGNAEMEALLTRGLGRWWGGQGGRSSSSPGTLLGFADGYAQRLLERHGASQPARATQGKFKVFIPEHVLL